MYSVSEFKKGKMKLSVPLPNSCSRRLRPPPSGHRARPVDSSAHSSSSDTRQHRPLTATPSAHRRPRKRLEKGKTNRKSQTFLRRKKPKQKHTNTKPNLR